MQWIKASVNYRLTAYVIAESQEQANEIIEANGVELLKELLPIVNKNPTAIRPEEFASIEFQLVTKP